MTDEDVTSDDLDDHDRFLDSEWAELLTIKGSLIESIPHDHPYLANGVFEQAATTRKQCVRLISRLRGQLAKKAQPPITPPSFQHHDQLKRLDIKPFEGNPSQWKEFSDLFTSLMGSKSTIPPVEKLWKEFSDLFTSLMGSKSTIPPVEKLVRLKSSLRGPTAALISTIPLSDQNYENAWRKLQKKYDDPRLLAQYLFSRVLELPKITKPTEQNLTDNVAAVVESLDQLRTVAGLSEANLTEQLFAHLLRKSLDAESLRQWELKLGDAKDFPSLKEFVVFVESCARGINAGSKLHSRQQITAPSKPPIKKKGAYAATQQVEDSAQQNSHQRKECSMCKGNHFVDKCQQFKELDPVKRNGLAIDKKLCFRCLGTHKKDRCSSDEQCHKCKGSHHTLIHGGSRYTGWAPPRRDSEAAGFSGTANRPAEERIDEDQTKPSTSTAAVNLNNQMTNGNQQSNQPSEDQQSVLLATARVTVKSPRGFSSRARVLIDQGSEVSFISEKLVNQLHLPRKSTTLELIGIGGVNSGSTRGLVSVTLQAINGNQQVQISAHILKKLTAILPSFSCASANIGSLENLQLADQQYLKPGPIDIIIGADNYGRIIRDEVVKSKQSKVVGQRTVFGWILSGPINCTGCSARISLSAVRTSSNEQLLELLQKFWVQEELPVQQSENSELSPDELECEKHFRSTHSRDSTGRYIVRLPLKTSTAALGESKFKASRQLRSTVSKLTNNQAYAQLYKEFINEYETLGHMQRAPETAEPVPVYYLPHHGVLRADAITTRLRVVFNGSSPTSSGTSLNDILHPGGKLQTNAMDVLTWMRKHRLVFGTDIVKMFRQIRVHQDDWDLQRILWVDDNKQQISYQLTTVTYGLNCSPWLSLRVLQQLAEDEGPRFPAAVETITRGRYVDDIYGGADSPAELKEIVWQLQGLCQAGGFPLQKWSSNCPQLLHELGLSTEEEVIQFEESVTKVLGLCWHQSSDTFQYKSRDFKTETITKRIVSSEIAQIFDPLGFIAPVVVQGKILLQDLWKLKCSWDDPLPEEYIHRWESFRQELTELDKVAVPRWLRISPQTNDIQLHGFADASTVAMSAVVYIRTQNLNEPASTVLVCAKTKVAPIKRMTIPRLELTAALLLTQLVTSTQQMLQLDQVETHLWSDSAVALAWIRSPASRWKDFVHNRVVKIQETLPNATWRHVSGKENPADCASRGITPSQLADHHLWWTGPDWINQDPEDWPRSTINAPPMDIPEVAKEAKPAKSHPVGQRINEIAELLNRYSTMAKLLAVTATINRAIDRFRRQPMPPGSILTTRELNDARLFWVKITQHQYFVSELRVLLRNQQLPRNHQLAKFTPTLDEEGIMRLGGRLKNSELHPEQIHTIILPRRSRFTTLTPSWTGSATDGSIARNQSLTSKSISPQGVDYAGPFAILKWRPTNAQPGSVHIAVFVCFTTSAVHLEVVNRQTTDAFLGAYKRFTGSRGIPAVMYSDNTTTFVGAADQLERLYHQASKENQRVQAALATNGTQWSFSPPRAPHFGGKWEAAVKSKKHHLKRVLGTTTLTFEELNTVLVQIEACLNSRPICPMSDDPEDLQVLTPGHFLIGEPLQIVPGSSYVDENPLKMRRWNLVTRIVQQFWSRWSKECLQRYQAIYKWKTRQQNIEVGNMVLMVDDNLPPAQWPIARVIATRPGADGLTRVATVRTSKAEVGRHQDGSPNLQNITAAHSVFDRPITKLCLLPTDPPTPEQPPEEDHPDDEDDQQQGDIQELQD
ncbi:uncharacterized protein LOC107043042 [Diachasma alloeum]|uniref:uncharacterized protein LOC107043042 n=1 Tax=Diachasma alloeum TaxID=454923 RepID=UPI0007383BA3|nr:uncharacterized protein LOC107043042 [Diachasma alloeum]